MLQYADNTSVGQTCARNCTDYTSSPLHPVLHYENLKTEIIRRRLERKVNKSGLPSDRDAYSRQCKYINYLLTKAKTDFLSIKICNSKSDKDRLFNTAKEILCWKDEPTFPKDIKPEQLPHDLADYFIDKIVRIMAEISDFILSDAVSDITEAIPA